MEESSLASDPPPAGLAVAAPRHVGFRRTIVDRVIALARQGATPRQISISIAVGAAIGVFPALGTTTAICLAVAWLFRLNIAAMQIPNYLVYPAQLALIVPFIRLGERLFGAPHLSLSLPSLVAEFRGGTWHAIIVLWRSLMYASAAWLLCAPVAALLVYLVVLPVVRRLSVAYVSSRARPAVL